MSNMLFDSKIDFKVNESNKIELLNTLSMDTGSGLNIELSEADLKQLLGALRIYDPKPIIGQEAICPDGLGRVVKFDDKSITVSTYFKDRQCHWAKHEVELIDPRGE